MATQTLEQQRAIYALNAVRSHQNDQQAPRYSTLVKSLPAMVLNNGLGQALAFLLASDLAAHQLYSELSGWICGQWSDERPERVYTDENKDFVQALMEGSRFQYQRAQQTALALLAWMRKFAEAYLPREGL